MLSTDPKLSTNLGDNDADESLYGGAKSVKQQIDIFCSLNEKAKLERNKRTPPMTPKSTNRSVAVLSDGKPREVSQI